MIKQIIDFYFILLRKIIPLKILTIRTNCILRKDCKEDILIQVLTDKSVFELPDIFDFVFKSMDKHLKTHKINSEQILGLQWIVGNSKYTVYKGIVEHE